MISLAIIIEDTCKLLTEEWTKDPCPNCLKDVITESVANAYALGVHNMAMIALDDPDISEEEEELCKDPHIALN